MSLANAASPQARILARMAKRRARTTSPAAEGAPPSESVAECSTVVFLGAGASAPAHVPLTRAFVGTLREDLETRAGLQQGAEVLAAYNDLVEFLTAYSSARVDAATPNAIDQDLADVQPDIEMVYEALVRLADPDSDPLLHGRTRLPVTAPIASILKLAAERHIREKAFLAPDKMAYLDNLIGLRTQGRVTVFSTNYDTGIEALCERHGLRWEDGFRVRWDSSVFEEPDIDFCLHKLHGSVLWYRDDLGGYFRSPLRPTETDGRRLRWFGGDCDPMLVYPARKSAQDAPYAHSMRQLAQTLGAPDTEIALLVIGYSFRDAHLRQILFDAARTNALLAVVLVAPDATQIYESQLARHGDGDSPLSRRVLCVNEALDDAGAVLQRIITLRAGRFQRACTSDRNFRLSRSGSEHQARDIARDYAAAGDSEGFDRLIATHRGLRAETALHEDLVDHLTSIRLALQGLRSAVEVRRRAEAFGARCRQSLGEFRAAFTVGDRPTWRIVFENTEIPSNATRALAHPLRDAMAWTGAARGRVRRRLDAFLQWVGDLPPLFSHCKQESDTWTLSAGDLVALTVLPHDWADRETRGTPAEFRDDVGAGLMRLLDRHAAGELERLVMHADSDE